MSELAERLRKYAASEELRGFILPNWDVPLGQIPKGARLVDDLREAADALEREQKALRRIADNYEDGATLSGTQCAEIAAEAMSAIYVDEDV